MALLDAFHVAHPGQQLMRFVADMEQMHRDPDREWRSSPCDVEIYYDGIASRENVETTIRSYFELGLLFIPYLAVLHQKYYITETGLRLLQQFLNEWMEEGDNVWVLRVKLEEFKTRAGLRIVRVDGIGDEIIGFDEREQDFENHYFVHSDLHIEEALFIQRV